MSVNIYYKDAVQQYEGFKVTPSRDRSSDDMVVAGLNVLQHEGRLYSILGDNSTVPKVLEEFVDEVSFHLEFTAERVQRETGIYKHASATADVNYIKYANHPSIYRLIITGKKMEDVRQLLHLIKTGSIRPEESYEGVQQGMSRVDLQGELERLKGELTESQKWELVLEERIRDGRKYRDDLHSSRWPLMCKKTAVEQLRMILR